MKLRRWLGEYMQLLEIDRAERTLEQYRHLIRAYIAPAIGDQEMDEISPMAIDTLLGRIRAKGYDRTAQQVRGLLLAAYRRALRYDMCERNPVERTEPVRHKAALTRSWNLEQARIFLASTRDSEWHCAWLLMLCCGLRRGELLGLRWEDIDFARLTVRIERQRVRCEKRLIEIPPKSEASRATIPIDAAVAARLAPVARFRRYRGYLFDGVSPERLRRALKRDIARAQLPPIGLHGLRHTLGAIATGDGVSMRVLQEVMRHASYTTTASIYAHVTDGDKMGAVSSVAHLTLNQGVPGSSP